jgi:HAMP domain-containing protein
LPQGKEPVEKMNSQFSIRTPQSLRGQLFISSALLTSALVLVTAWVINSQVIGQVRQQVQAEVETLLPLYESVWDEHARRLATMGAALADSPIVKLVFGNAGASRDQRTLHEMVADVSEDTLTTGDLVLMSEGSGKVFFAEQQDATSPEMANQIGNLEAARIASESQKQSRGFTMIGGRLYQLVATPVLLHSGSDDAYNMLSVISIAEEVNRGMAAEIKLRMHSEVIFLLEGRLYASSLAAENEQAAFKAIQASDLAKAALGRSTEVNLDGQTHLAFARQLTDFDGKPIGQVVVLRSLAGANKLFRAISNRLLVLWTLAIVAALALSYLVAGRITRPLEKLVVSAKELGRGNYDIEVPTGAHGEVAQLATAFDQMRHSLRQSQAALLKNERLATIGQMASSIIHDLRNPLATIFTAAEVMMNDGLPADRRQTLIETQLRASGRMNSMLAELLEFSRGSYKLNLQRLALADVVGRAFLRN